MSQPEVGDSIVIYREPHSYCSHPCIARLANGDWLVAFSACTQRQPYTHPPNDPQFINLVSRSGDLGASWEPPRVAPDYDWYGVEVPGIAQISSGDVLMNQWRFRWYPVELGKKLWSAGAQLCYIEDSETQRWRPADSEADWEKHGYPYTRADDGAYVHISRDGGATWELTVPLEIAPYQAAFSPQGAIESKNGDLLLALGSHDHDPHGASFLVRSLDQGRSWERPIEAARAEGLTFSEPSLAETRSGKLIVMSREENTGFIFQSVSSDQGATWAAPRQLPFWGFPTHCICMDDGRILIVYGRRKRPFGIRAAVSEDEGETWGGEVVLRDDLPNGNLGYPSVIEYAPGQLFTAYYGEDAGGVTCIQGTYFTI